MAASQTISLLDLPLEIRHTIFKHVASRGINTKKMLRYWFEKEEVKVLIAKHATQNPGGQTPRALYDDSTEDDIEADEQEDDDDDDQEDGDDGHGDSDDDGEQGGEDEDEDENEEDAEEDDDGLTYTVLTSLPTAQLPSQTHSVTPGQTDTDSEDEHDLEEDVEAEAAEDNVEMMDDEAGSDEEDDNMEQDAQDHLDGETTADGADDGNLELVAPGTDENVDTQIGGRAPEPVPTVRAARKWRHIPNFMRITHCPPSVNLFLASKQLNQEAKNWFYDVAVLRIEATGSFAHTSFFEEAFNQIVDAPFSPIENIRKVEITFVWDTTWIRADTTGFVEAVFPALLRQRADFVYKILSKAPDLSQVTIHWHDSAQDNESANLMLDVLGPFHCLPATIQVIEHYIAADVKPYKRSIAGKRRIEFQNIVDAGLERLL